MSSQYINKKDNYLNNASSSETTKKRDREIIPRKIRYLLYLVK